MGEGGLTFSADDFDKHVGPDEDDHDEDGDVTRTESKPKTEFHGLYSSYHPDPIPAASRALTAFSASASAAFFRASSTAAAMGVYETRA